MRRALRLSSGQALPLLLLSAAGCGAAAQSGAAGCRAGEPTGDRAELTLADTNVEGATVDPPIGCDGGWYVRLWREGGEHEITLPREAACNQQPGEDDDCPSVSAASIFRETAHALEAQGIEVTGLGVGPCGDPRGGYSAGRYSVAVGDWSDADEAVRALAETMRRWDVRGEAGVAIRARRCHVSASQSRAARAGG